MYALQNQVQNVESETQLQPLRTIHLWALYLIFAGVIFSLLYAN
jgi:hypothetical protein